MKWPKPHFQEFPHCNPHWKQPWCGVTGWTNFSAIFLFLLSFLHDLATIGTVPGVSDNFLIFWTALLVHVSCAELYSEPLRFGSFESLISGSKMKWRWGLLQCGPGLQRWESKLATQDCLVTREYLLWIWTWLILQYYYPLILLCLIHSNLTAESGCSISLSSSGRGREGHRRERNGETLGNHHHSMELRKWKVSFVMDNGMEQWCLMIDLIMKREYCKIKANVDC